MIIYLSLLDTIVRQNIQFFLLWEAWKPWIFFQVIDCFLPNQWSGGSIFTTLHLPSIKSTNVNKCPYMCHIFLNGLCTFYYVLLFLLNFNTDSRALKIFNARNNSSVRFPLDHVSIFLVCCPLNNYCLSKGKYYPWKGIIILVTTSNIHLFHDERLPNYSKYFSEFSIWW